MELFRPYIEKIRVASGELLRVLSFATALASGGSGELLRQRR